MRSRADRPHRHFEIRAETLLQVLLVFRWLQNCQPPTDFHRWAVVVFECRFDGTLANMPQIARIAPGGQMYNVLNRAAARFRMLRTDEDFAAFHAVSEEALERSPTRILSYGFMGNHWHLVVWPRRDGEHGFLPVVGAYARAAMAGGASKRRTGPAQSVSALAVAQSSRFVRNCFFTSPNADASGPA